ncbi:MAG: apolipoprotein N-acyltransferase [Desulfobacterales bacterium]|nr:MAG: apolipoprotein N-acyltransferase [Desulfobacterales bacterium]
MKLSIVSIFYKYLPAILTGVLLTAAFPDAGLYPMAFIALVPLWTALNTLTPRQAFYSGLTAGIVHYLTLIYWIVHTLTQFGNLPMVAALGCLLLLAFYLALYPAVFALVLKKCLVPNWLMPFWGAVVWTGLEYIRTHAFTGFPWGVLGYSQYTNALMAQVADITGILGISFILVSCNGIISQWVEIYRHHHRFDRWCLLSSLLAVILVSGVYIYGANRMNTVSHWTAAAETATIAIIQGNIEQEKKWDSAFKKMTLDRYEALSLSSLPADLVVWPETAMPFYYGNDMKTSAQINDLVITADTCFLIGGPAVEIEKEEIRYFNRAYMFNSHARITGIYDKTHLVPFGEYVPLQDLLWFVENLTAQAGYFSKGTTGPFPLEFNTHKTGVLICFEILFPDISRQFVLNNADILTTLTNDAWFGRTSAPAQHFSVAVFRAIENRRTMVRAANTGISGVIAPSGQVIAKTDVFTATTLTRNIPALKQITFYTRHGDLIGPAALVAIVLGFMVKTINTKKVMV